MTKGSHAGLACLISGAVLSCLVSFNLLHEKFDARLALKDAIIASLDAKLVISNNIMIDGMKAIITRVKEAIITSMHDELLSTNAMVDSMTQEMEKLGVELVSKNDKLQASNEAIHSLEAKLAKKDEIMIDGMKAISKNIMVDGMTQEMEKLGVELVSNNTIVASSLDAKLASKNIMIDGTKAIITPEWNKERSKIDTMWKARPSSLKRRGNGLPKLSSPV